MKRYKIPTKQTQRKLQTSVSYVGHSVVTITVSKLTEIVKFVW